MPQHRDAQGRFAKRRHPRRYPKGHRARLKVVPSLRKKGLSIYKSPRGPLTIPLKCGYEYTVPGTGAASLDFTQIVGFQQMPAAWFNRYQPLFDYVKINKIRVEITCPYNIGQSGVGNQSLYRIWYKRALTTGETVPDSHTEWLNDQRAVRKTFSGTNNAVNLYWTPVYETTVQPLNTAVTQLRLLGKQWQTIQTTPGAMVPMIGALATVYRMDGGAINNTHVFRVNVTMYCELKGLKEL